MDEFGSDMVNLHGTQADQPDLTRVHLRRARKKLVSIEQLGPHGVYVPVSRSRFLPVRPEDVTRWVYTEDSADRLTWEERLREWVRNELVPRANA